MPRVGIDIYGCCFPCGPWSGQGKGLGFKDDAAQPVYHAVNTIKIVQPIFYYMENVLKIAASKTTCVADEDNEVMPDLTVIEQFLGELLPNYDHALVQGISPTHYAYPVVKRRVTMAGSRIDQVKRGALQAALGRLVQAPMQASIT